MKRPVFLIAFLCFAFSCFAQNNKEQSPILFIYDASGSMWGQLDGKRKKDIAATVLTQTVNKLPANQKIGLVAYGHRKKGDCKDVEFLASLDNTNKQLVNNAIKKINPLGRTPLAYSATLTINKLRQSKTKATIILVTDGIESCGGNICDVVTKAKAEGIDFKMHIVGFGLKESETEQLKCAANTSGGKYYDAQDAKGLGDVINDATAQTVDEPEGNFTVYTTKNGKPIDASVMARKKGSKKFLTGDRTYKDTAKIYLKPGTYEIVISALENTDLKPITKIVEIKKEGQEHRNISFDAAKLFFYTTVNNKGRDATVKVFDSKTNKVVTGIRTYGREKFVEVPPGNYYARIQALNIKGLNTNIEKKNITVTQNKSVKIKHDFKTGIAKIGVQTKSGELIDASVTFKEVKSKKQVAAARTYTSKSSNPRSFEINPGTYDVKINTLGKHKGNTKTIRVVIEQGGTVTKNLHF